MVIQTECGEIERSEGASSEAHRIPEFVVKFSPTNLKIFLCLGTSRDSLTDKTKINAKKLQNGSRKILTISFLILSSPSFSFIRRP